MDKAIRGLLIFAGLILIKIATMSILDIPLWIIVLIFLLLYGAID